MNKSTRQLVHQKYDGHCAYCGCKMDIKDMQIDHVHPRDKGGGNEIENLNPACRSCNFYKSTWTIDQFREQIELQLDRLRKIFIFNMSERYGIIHCTPKKVKFYFEQNKPNQ